LGKGWEVGRKWSGRVQQGGDQGGARAEQGRGKGRARVEQGRSKGGEGQSKGRARAEQGWGRVDGVLRHTFLGNQLPMIEVLTCPRRGQHA